VRDDDDDDDGAAAADDDDAMVCMRTCVMIMRWSDHLIMGIVV
jgi:hypothetical protein